MLAQGLLIVALVHLEALPLLMLLHLVPSVLVVLMHQLVEPPPV